MPSLIVGYHQTWLRSFPENPLHRRHIAWNRRVKFLFVTSFRKWTTVFSTCMSLKLTQNTMWRRRHRCFFKMQQRQNKYVPGGLPPVTLNVFALCWFHWWVTGCGDRGYSERDSHLPCKKVASIILKYVWIRQEKYFYHFGVGHTLVHPGSRVPAHRINVQHPQWE